MASDRVSQLALALALLLFTPSSASAQSAEERETARTLMERGDKAAAAGDEVGALEAYAAADDIMRVPSTGLARGRSLVKVGRLVEASDVFLRVARSPAVAGEDPVLAEARNDATRLAAELAGRIPSVTVEVTGVAKDTATELKINGKSVSSKLIGLPIKVDPGAHRLEVSAPGYRSAVRDFSLREAEQTRLDVSLEKDPNAVVRKTEEPRGPTRDAPPGAAEEGGVPVWAWVVGAIGVGSLVGSGAGLGVQLSAAGELDDQCGEDRTSCPRSYDFSSDRSNEQIGNGLFIGLGIAGILGVGAGIVGIATAPASASKTASWRLTPWVGAEAGGWIVSGSFGAGRAGR